MIEFIRHGLPLGGKCYRGSGIDDPLSETGWQQMWAAIGEDAYWHRIVSSPMLRCHSFAQALAEKLDLPIAVEQDIREVGFGSWEGKTREQLIAENADEFQAFYQDPVSNRPPGAESLEALIDRVSSVVQAISAKWPEEKVLVVAHAGVMRAALAYALDVPPASMYRIRIDYAKRMLITAGDPPQFEL